ncbi:MAG TPA: sigma-70 family RNA polymerase sigma factor [Vicinamibacteria bacterium]|nr:sigma-70 family RNA polymerase sigma factor [Vicinamibacteria bacterium]
MASDRLSAFRSEALVHLPELVRVALRLAGDRSDADDLVQETFLQAWRSFDRFAPGTNCRAWLFRILILVAHGQRRRNGRARGLALDDLPDAAVAVEDHTPDYFTREHLLVAFHSLAEEQRLVVQLADVEGLRYREVAEALGIPVGTVMSRLSRARSLLRRRLAERLQATAPAARGAR